MENGSNTPSGGDGNNALKRIISAAAQYLIGKKTGIVKHAGRTAKKAFIVGIAICIAVGFMLLYLLCIPMSFFLGENEIDKILTDPSYLEELYQSEYEKFFENAADKLDYYFREYCNTYAVQKAQEAVASYGTAFNNVTWAVTPSDQTYSLSEKTANDLYATFYLYEYLMQKDPTDMDVIKEEFWYYMDKYFGDESLYNGKSALRCIVNKQVTEYEVIDKAEYELQSYTKTTHDDEKGTVTQTFYRQVCTKEEQRYTAYKGQCTANVTVSTSAFMAEEMKSVAKLLNDTYNTNDSDSYLYLTLDDATDTQRAIVEAALNTPTTAAGYCAGWITNVYQNALGYTVGGDACDMYTDCCTSSDYEDLEIGMIVAVESSSSGTVAGATYGHVGIYIGEGQIIHSIGEVVTESLDSWISKYGQYCGEYVDAKGKIVGPVMWGYPEYVSDIIDDEKMESAGTSETVEKDIEELKEKYTEDDADKDNAEDATASAETSSTSEKETAGKSTSTDGVRDNGDGTMTVSGTKLRNAIVNYASEWVGITPYVTGGRSLETGTDCSGFNSLIYKEVAGMNVWPGSDYYGYVEDANYAASIVSSGYLAAEPITEDELEPGDIVVYNNGSHVALYIGGDSIINHGGGSDGTELCSIKSISYRDDVTGYCRFIDDDAEYTISSEFDISDVASGKSGKTSSYKKIIADIAESLWLEFCNDGEDVFTHYEDLTDSELEIITSICYAEQFCGEGACMEASLMANCYELYGSDYGSLFDYIMNCGQWAYTGELDVTSDIVDDIREVLVNGHRTLPAYIDTKVTFGSENYDLYNNLGEQIDADNTSLYRRNLTNIVPKLTTRQQNEKHYDEEGNLVSSEYIQEMYTFYKLAPVTKDVFCYSSEDIRSEKGEEYFSYGTWVFMYEYTLDSESSTNDYGLISLPAGYTPTQDEIDLLMSEDYIYQSFITVAKSQGFTREAIIGILCYMHAEGRTYGFMTYEGCLSGAPDPNGNSIQEEGYTPVFDNQAWLDWLSADTCYVLQSYGYPATGALGAVGILSESDLWHNGLNNPKTGTFCTDLILEADAEGLDCHDPAFLCEKACEEILAHADDDPSVWGDDYRDPTTYTGDISEYAKRVLCFMGMPAWTIYSVNDSKYYYYYSQSAVDLMTQIYDEYS